MIRVREVNLRPQKIQELKDALNTTEYFLQAARLLFLKKEDDEKPFTESEITSLEKVVKEIYVSLFSDDFYSREKVYFNSHGVIKF